MPNSAKLLNNGLTGHKEDQLIKLLKKLDSGNMGTRVFNALAVKIPSIAIEGVCSTSLRTDL